MQIIDYGYKLPEQEDKTFFDSYNFDITRLSTHNHDGENSAPLSPGHMAPTLVLVEAVDWTGPTDEVYSSPNIPLPSSVTWTTGNPCPILVKGFTSGNKSCNVEYERVDDNNFKVTQMTTQELVVGLY